MSFAVRSSAHLIFLSCLHSMLGKASTSTFAMAQTVAKGVPEMSEKLSEKSKMSASSVEFAQFALKERVAPKAIGSIKERLTHARRVMGRRSWSENRVKDCWYADPRISPNADEIRDIEEITGLRYGRDELRTNDNLIAAADALLDGPDADFYRPFVTAFRAMARAFDRSRTGE